LEALNLKINMNTLKRIIPVIVGLFVLPLFAQSAQATEVDFACGGTVLSILPCNGAITATYSNPFTLTSASTTSAITVLNSQGPDLFGFFNLTFDTGAGTISLVETADDFSTLTGTIVGFGGVQGGGEDNVDLVVNWSNIPADFQSFLGTATGTGITTDVSLSVNGTTETAAVSIIPTPEPASLLLLGSGLLSFGGLLRRRVLRA